MLSEVNTTPAVSSGVGLPKGTVLGPAFFARSSDEVARDLIGKILWTTWAGGGRLTEVEAYLPTGDPASHGFHGPTRRNEAMFGPAGTIYVFLSYGIHQLLNLVCEGPGVGSAVLIRAVEGLSGGAPVGGGHIRADARRSGGSHCGPGRVGTALGIHPGLNGLPLGAMSGLYVLDDGSRPDVGMTTRIGISRGATLPLRYYAAGSMCVTRRSAIRGGVTL
jgi:DNA-3-methyladenine glycosylase